MHHCAYLDGYTRNYRYPYEFRISGATPSGYESGYQKPAAATGTPTAAAGSTTAPTSPPVSTSARAPRSSATRP
ncbi:hypothetical protein [Streptomyces sp. NPDC054834]